MAEVSLEQRFGALQAERARSWSQEQLAKNAEQRAALVAHYDPESHARPGDILPPFALVDQDGAILTSDQILARGAAVLVFFRFGTCPADNIALPYYNEKLWPALAAAGVPLVAVSAQTPVDRTPIDLHGLGYIVASDPGYALARILGITFLPDDQPVVAPGESWIGTTLGTHSYELPQPSIVILEPDRTIRFIAVSPDWLDRPEAETILEQLPEVRAGVR